MEEAAAVRRAAGEALGDVEPACFREEVLNRLAPSTVPGLLVLAAARTGGDATFADVETRAVGVQLIYDGLRLTRELAVTPPWEAGAGDEADLAILAADVLVARGAYLLAGTEASEAAVEVIRSFGRDQSLRDAADDPTAVDRRLESDVFELAAVAGTTATGSCDAGVVRWAGALVDEFEGDTLPPAETLLPPDLRVETPREVDGGEAAGRLTSLDS